MARVKENLDDCNLSENSKKAMNGEAQHTIVQCRAANDAHMHALEEAQNVLEVNFGRIQEIERAKGIEVTKAPEQIQTLEAANEPVMEVKGEQEKEGDLAPDMEIGGR